MIEKTIMKYIIRGSVISMALISCGCSTQYLSSNSDEVIEKDYWPIYKEIIYVADYRPYAESGFTISPTSSGFTYHSIGEITMIFSPGVLAPIANEWDDTSKHVVAEPYIRQDTYEVDTEDYKYKAKWQIETSYRLQQERREQERREQERREQERKRNFFIENYYQPTFDEMIDKIVKKAKELGANALLNFKIIVGPAQQAIVGGINIHVSAYEYVLQGFAVKLND